MLRWHLASEGGDRLFCEACGAVSVVITLGPRRRSCSGTQNISATQGDFWVLQDDGKGSISRSALQLTNIGRSETADRQRYVRPRRRKRSSGLAEATQSFRGSVTRLS